MPDNAGQENRTKQKDGSRLPDEPGRMVTIDIISNPFNSGLNKKSYFVYYLLLVDVYSTLPVLFGLKSLIAHNIMAGMAEKLVALVRSCTNAKRSG
jgi:hypothetical protein